MNHLYSCFNHVIVDKCKQTITFSCLKRHIFYLVAALRKLPLKFDGQNVAYCTDMIKLLEYRRQSFKHA